MKENMNINDLCMLESQDDEDIVKIILERYESDYIYTYIGDILISVNPYKDVPINSEEVSRRYKNERSLTRSDAHVFGIVNDIYQCLTVNTESQCFIVSGESGAGKTDTVKLAVDHFLSLGPLDMNYMERISETSIILEAFGNALTSLNKNATRFGKYLQFHFSKEVRVCGVTITEYLLESSRLSCGKQGEQNFHIFYYMFSGRTEDDLSKQLLDSPSQHRYLNYGEAFSEELLLWSLEYKKLMQAFNSIGFKMEETTEIFGLLSAILHIGDIKFICEDPNTGVFIDNIETLDKVSILLGVDTSDLELCMTCNMVSRSNDNVSGFKSESEANTCRDSISKSLYARLFSWIVCKINFLLNPDDMKKRRIEQLTVAFLDVFGFEDFQMNSLEQLCINTTNEQIALHFTQHVFALEQVEYQQEELLDMDIMEYFDNKNIINLLLEKPHGIFSLLEEESKCLQADDQTLVSSFNAHCSEQKHYISSNAKTPSFNIVHYNKKVTYSAEEFLDKNNDKLEGSFVECLRGSSDILVSTLYSSTLSKTGSLSLKAGNGDVYCCTGDLRTSYEKRVKHRLKNGADTNKACRNTKSKQKTMTGRKQKNVLTVATYFRNSLVDLMENILLCQAHFVRCIKPNKSKEPNKFDKDFVKAQIKCSGIVDTMKIRKYGFSVRLPFKTFLDRYRFINFNASSTLESNIDNCKRILERSQVTDYRFGKTKVFLRQSHIHQLSSALQELIGKVVITQKMVRGHLARIDFDFLQTTRKQEERNLGNLLVSISSRSNKMHDNLLILNQADLKRHERLKEKEMKKRDPEKENQLQKRKLTNPTDPDSLKMREFKKSSGNTAEETPNRKVPRNKSRTHGEPLIRNFTSSPQSTWCRVDCYERQHHIASFQMEEAVICVDGTHPFSDKNRIAFAALPSRADDPKVTKVKSCIGKGVQLHQDERQNLWATRLGKNPIFVRGHTLCPELVKLNGKLTQGVPMKVLDTAAFKDYMREEVDNNGGVNEDVKERIMSKLKICMSFIKDTAVDEDTPCWFEIWLLKVKDQVKRYLENQQKREKRKSGHLDMRVQTPQDSTKRLTGMPEMRRAKSGDHIRVERRPRSNTTNLSGSKESPSNKVPRPRPPSQNFSHQVIDKSLMRQQQQLQLSQDVIRREKSMDMIRREKSMDVRVESRMLMDREYRQSMGRPLIDGNQINRVRNGNSPSPSPPQSLMRSSGSNSSKRESTVDNGRLTNGNGTPLLNDPELRRGNSVTAPKAGMSYRQVFGLQSSDYLFNVTPPNYTRHRRFSDSDTESLHNFNFIHKVITAPSTPPISALGRQSPPSLQQQMSQQQQQHQTEDSKGNILSKKWMNKIRRKSEDNPKKKVSPQLSNK